MPRYSNDGLVRYEYEGWRDRRRLRRRIGRIVRFVAQGVAVALVAWILLVLVFSI